MFRRGTSKLFIVSLKKDRLVRASTPASLLWKRHNGGTMGLRIWSNPPEAQDELKMSFKPSTGRMRKQSERTGRLFTGSTEGAPHCLGLWEPRHSKHTEACSPPPPPPPPPPLLQETHGVEDELMERDVRRRMIKINTHTHTHTHTLVLLYMDYMRVVIYSDMHFGMSLREVCLN